MRTTKNSYLVVLLTTRYFLEFFWKIVVHTIFLRFLFSLSFSNKHRLYHLVEKIKIRKDRTWNPQLVHGVASSKRAKTSINEKLYRLERVLKVKELARRTSKQTLPTAAPVNPNNASVISHYAALLTSDVISGMAIGVPLSLHSIALHF